ncbi:MAG: hypothetical protein JXR11_02585 [Balneola sp.]
MEQLQEFSGVGSIQHGTPDKLTTQNKSITIAIDKSPSTEIRRKILGEFNHAFSVFRSTEFAHTLEEAFLLAKDNDVLPPHVAQSLLAKLQLIFSEAVQNLEEHNAGLKAELRLQKKLNSMSQNELAEQFFNYQQSELVSQIAEIEDLLERLEKEIVRLKLKERDLYKQAKNIPFSFKQAFSYYAFLGVLFIGIIWMDWHFLRQALDNIGIPYNAAQVIAALPAGIALICTHELAKFSLKNNTEKEKS